MIAGVIDTLTPYEGEVRDKDGHWYVLRVRPYVTLDGKIDGASVVLVDIDSIKRGHAGRPGGVRAADVGGPHGGS